MRTSEDVIIIFDEIYGKASSSSSPTRDIVYPYWAGAEPSILQSPGRTRLIRRIHIRYETETKHEGATNLPLSRSAMKLELPLTSSIVTTFADLLLDVIGLWLLDHALLRVAVYLNSCEVYDAHNSIRISDVWFESVSGRSHGPMWFRKAQVALKLVMLACSIAVGLSIDGFSRDRKVRMLDETVLVPQVRRMAQLGIGGFNNFSTDVLFVFYASRCYFADNDDVSGLHTFTYWNARALVPIHPDNYWRPTRRLFPLECLSKKNDFYVSPIRRIARNTTTYYREKRCIENLPNITEIKNGTYNVTVTKSCSWHSPRLECQAKHWGGCALTMEKGEDQMIYTWEYRGVNVPVLGVWDEYKLSQKRDAETLRMMAMYLDFGLSASVPALDHITSFQAGLRGISKVEGRLFLSQINVGFFLIGLTILATIVSSSIVSAMQSHLVLSRRKRSDYALGLRVAEVARFARMDVGDIHGESLFLTLHPDFPRLTVSGTGVNCGSWDKDKVLGEIN